MSDLEILRDMVYGKIGAAADSRERMLLGPAAEASDWPAQSTTPIDPYSLRGSGFDPSSMPRAPIEDRRFDRRYDRRRDLHDEIRSTVEQSAYRELFRREPSDPWMGQTESKSMIDDLSGGSQPAHGRIGFAGGGATPFPDGRDPEAALRTLADEIPQQPAQPSMLDRLSQTWPARLAQDAWSAATLPRDVAMGRVSHADLYDPDSRLQERMLGLGSIPMVATTGAPAGALGAGFVRFGRPGRPEQTIPQPTPARESQNFPSPVPEPIRAYHGSPHNFDRFRMSAMGTGEGAQVYGPGLYFAENPRVAQHYREQLGPVLYSGRPYDKADPAHRVAERVALYSDQAPQQTMDQLRRYHAQDFLQHRADRAAGVPSYLRSSQIQDMLAESRVARSGQIPEVTQGGRMYEVDLHARPSQVLDFDRGLLTQPQGAQDALGRRRDMAGTIDAHSQALERDRVLLDLMRSSGVDERTLQRQQAYVDRMAEGVPVSSVLDVLRRNTRPDQYLGTMRDAGILATRYLDNGSRGLPVGDPRRASNYVVHDDRIVDVLRKYGLAGAAATPLAGAYMGSDARGD